MDPKYYALGAVALLLILVGKRSFKTSPFFKKYSMAVDAFLFAGCFLLLGFFFYQKKEKAGILAVGLGAIGIGKYLYDRSRDEGEPENK
jgi:hypothetical protein